MLLGGLLAAHIAGLTVLGLGLATGGAIGALSVVIGFALVVVFFSLGQAIELVALELRSTLGLIVTLASYGVRVICLGLALRLVIAAGADRLSPEWLFAGVVAGVLGWVSGIVIVAARQRVPVFDNDYQPPKGWQDGQ